MLSRLLACFVALASAMATFATFAPAGHAASASSTDDLSAWTSCGGLRQCAVLSVPVDYAHPDGEQVAIAVARLRATDPSRRVGSLVFNFGGPGDAGTSTLSGFAREVPGEIRARYDLVSLDPRGTGSSRPVKCVDDATADRLNAVDPTPNSEGDLRSFYDGSHEPVDVVARCVARNGTWLAQLGSRNVARDLDRLRVALAEEKLSYVGFSYGTVIGAVYAQMFPDRVGRMVLDSPVDLSASPLQELRANSQGFEQALDDFLANCAAHPSCSFHGTSDPTKALGALETRFEQGLSLPTVDPVTGRSSKRKAGVAAFYTALISALYDKRYGWPLLADALQRATKDDGTDLLDLADTYNGRRANGTYDNVNEVIGIILCDDRNDAPPTFDEYRAEYRLAVTSYPLLGGYVGSTALGCDPRLPKPPASETVGDVRVDGTAPILIVGTTRDPATPYAGAQDLAARLAGSRLLTFASTEHTAYPKSRCINDAVDAYLLHGTLPPVNRRCRG